MSDEQIVAAVKAKADEAGIDPATLVVIIQAVIELVKWWRSRRDVKVGALEFDEDLLKLIVESIIRLIEAFRGCDCE